MSTPSGTPGPADDLGPEATPEQDAFARGLLAGLRADDPPMPDHVVARVDAVLAQERRPSAAVPLGTGAAPQDAEDEPGGAPVTVLPTQRRPDRSTRALQWLVGAAAAVLVVGGVGAVVSGTLGGSSSDSAATLAGADAGTVVASGTAYDQDNLAGQVRSLLSATSAQDRSGVDAPETEAGADLGSAGAGASAAIAPATLAGCVEQLTGEPGEQAVAVDRATYEGRAALVVVLTSKDEPGALDVWVVAPSCTREAADVLQFQRITGP